MAVFNYLNGVDWDSYGDFIDGTVTLRGLTTFKYTPAAGFFITVTGSGFTYDAKHVPFGGTITSVQIYHDGVHLGAYTGLTYALTDFVLFSLGLQSGVDTRIAPDPDALYTGMKTGDDQINGSVFGKNMEGHAGNDTLYGNGGDDWLNGGTGVDRFYGGYGMDGIYFSDVAIGGHGVHVDLNLATGNIMDDGYGNVETSSGVEKFDGSKFSDRLAGGVQPDSLWGEAGRDTLTGYRGDDYLYGGDGNDLIFGGDGNDVVEGGNGKDRLDGATGVDYLVFWHNLALGHGVSVNLALASNQVIDDGFGFAETAVNFEGVGGSDFGDTLTGDAGANELGGNAGNDMLYGGAGNDLLYGGNGSDQLFGGDGFNEFRGGGGIDTITVSSGIDWIVFDTARPVVGDWDAIHGIGFDDVIWIPTSWSPDLSSSGLTSGQIVFDVHGTTLTSPNVRVFATDTGWFYFDPDGNGTAAPIRLAHVDGTYGDNSVHPFDLA